MSKSVQSNSAVLVHFTLKLDDGSTAESTRSNGKPALFRLGDTSLSEGLEQQLLGLKEGEKKAFSLEPDAAFGVPSPDAGRTVHFDIEVLEIDPALEE
ncbi:hypothetical protein BXT92_10125 [Klebsiella pneumoniae]|nr:hypothetical protein BXT92_10125 [Klebsiella pneumoniae]